jgi:hypothetical protein
MFKLFQNVGMFCSCHSFSWWWLKYLYAKLWWFQHLKKLNPKNWSYTVWMQFTPSHLRMCKIDHTTYHSHFTHFPNFHRSCRFFFILFHSRVRCIKGELCSQEIICTSENMPRDNNGILSFTCYLECLKLDHIRL